MPRSPRPTAAATTPRSRKGVATRERLLQGAKAVFEETGFLDARITDIADRAGLSHGSFYHYFDSKEQAFREVAEAQEALLTAADDAGDTETHAGTGDAAGEDAAGTKDSDTTAGTKDGDTTAGTADDAVGGAVPDPTAGPASEIERIRRANRRYLERYRDNGRIMGVIEEVSRYDDHVNDARMRRQKHFADRAEQAIRRLQADGLADPQVDPEFAALALGSMMGRFAELWLVEEWGDFDFDDAVDQMTRLWANAIGLREGDAATPASVTSGTAASTPATAAGRGRPTTRGPGAAKAAAPDRTTKPATRRASRSTTSGATKKAKPANAANTRRRAG